MGVGAFRPLPRCLYLQHSPKISKIFSLVYLRLAKLEGIGAEVLEIVASAKDTGLSWIGEVWDDAGRWPVVGTEQADKLEV